VTEVIATGGGSRAPARFLAVAGGLLIALAVVALMAALWTPYPADVPDMGVALQDPSGAHWLGTDPAGRDVVSLLMKGLLTSFVLPISALVLAAIVALPLGGGAARWPRGMGGLLNGARTMLALLPAIIAAMLFATLWGASGMSAALALALGNVGPLAVATRDGLASLGSRGYVEAARLSGASRTAALRHVLPLIVDRVAAEALVLFAVNAAAEVGLSFLGLGVQPPAHSFGLPLHDAQSYIGAKPLLTILPGLLLALLIGASLLAAKGFRSRALRGEFLGAA
jgi:peptide/nickel transport system permease protein